jgi:hypothetical protein
MRLPPYAVTTEVQDAEFLVHYQSHLLGVLRVHIHRELI